MKERLENILNKTKNFVKTHKAELIGAYLGANYACLSYYNLYDVVNKYLFSKIPIWRIITIIPSMPPIYTLLFPNYLIGKINIPISEKYEPLMLISLLVINTALWTSIGYFTAKGIKKLYNRHKNKRESKSYHL